MTLFSLFFIVILIGCTSNVVEEDFNCIKPCHAPKNDVEDPKCYKLYPNEDIQCQMFIGIHDDCLRYISCEKTKDNCLTIINEEYESCIECTKNCVENDKIINAFKCAEEKCY